MVFTVQYYDVECDWWWVFAVYKDRQEVEEDIANHLKNLPPEHVRILEGEVGDK